MDTTALTTPIRRDQVRPGMIVHSSHGYRLLVSLVRDNAKNRTDARHVEIVGHLHANPERATRNEIYPAGSTIEVEVEPTRTPTRVDAFNDQEVVLLSQALGLLIEQSDTTTSDGLAVYKVKNLRDEFAAADHERFMTANRR